VSTLRILHPPHIPLMHPFLCYCSSDSCFLDLFHTLIALLFSSLSQPPPPHPGPRPQVLKQQKEGSLNTNLMLISIFPSHNPHSPKFSISSKGLFLHLTILSSHFSPPSSLSPITIYHHTWHNSLYLRLPFARRSRSCTLPIYLCHSRVLFPFLVFYVRAFLDSWIGMELSLFSLSLSFNYFVFTPFLPAASLLSSFTTQGSLLPFFFFETFHVQYMFWKKWKLNHLHQTFSCAVKKKCDSLQERPLRIEI
jgi:hypothetical protein